MVIKRNQRTLKHEVSFSGVGIHTGKSVSIRFCPAREDRGIYFQRIDLPDSPIIPANVRYVHETTRSTTLKKDNASVQTIEHLLAALFAYQIDNLCIQISGPEVPIGDGSSLTFVDMIERGEVEEQKATMGIVELKDPVYYSKGGTHLVALPSETYRISYTLDYPHTPLIGSQYFSFELTQENFRKEIASCRTFALYDEIAPLLEKGLLQGGNIENAVIVKDHAIECKGGLRFPNEMVRHKTLDLIGDLALVGFPFNAHIIAIRTGHESNVALGKNLLNKISAYE